MTCCSGPASPVSGNDAGRRPRLDDRAAAAAFDLGPLAPTRLSQTLARASGQADPTPAPTAAPQPSDTPASAPTGAPASIGSARTPRSVVVLGDSLSVWAFAPRATRGSTSGAWPSLLAARDGDLTLLRNAAVPGNTTTQMLARLRRDVLAYHPDVLFVLGGTNDVGKNYAISATVGNLRRIVEAAKAQGIEVVLLTIPPNNQISAGQLKRLRSINAALIRLAAAEDVAVVDVYAALASANGRLPRAYVAADGLHLSQRGEAVVAATVYARLTAPAPNSAARPAAR
ncbi:MAG: GDSL-type esterase/lipase family protein [Candidatus Limnocylindrales bacterium]|jgi:lysophospholipase L1-like esterase